MTKRLARVVGARPQFMQVPTVQRAIEQRGMKHILVHTGQHYDDAMSEAFFRDLDLPKPDINLNAGGLSQGASTGKIMEKLEAWLLTEKPDGVLVDGDTNSTMAAALAAVKLQIPVFHIEAGLRDFDRRRPEEINRIVTDHVATINFTPIPRATLNLSTEGRAHTSCEVGDVLLDCFLHFLPKARSAMREKLDLKPASYDLLTLHRPENTDTVEMERFRSIFSALRTIGRPIIWPVHPRARPILSEFVAAGGDLGSIRLIDPVSYLDMLGLMQGAVRIITDSGGLPREGVWSGKQVVMLFRMDTWHDLIEKRWATIGKTDEASVLAALDAPQSPAREAQAFFGCGQASDRVAEAIANYFEG
ncbi:MAG: UDP-N-acetylglucosamine 2-epimerase (non-hydrolyzing) [Acidobacteria bacterium]|nr:UDP-N-acetylglucosamine 2-epimerase (non-hydrolyzing) [Acidobacteriota bacterium]